MASRELVLYVFPRDDAAGDAAPRLGLSVSRKVGGAVERNRIKRLLREAFAGEGLRLPAGTDAVLVARRDVRAVAEGEGVHGVRRLLGELIGRAPGSRPADGGAEAARESRPEPADAAGGPGGGS